MCGRGTVVAGLASGWAISSGEKMEVGKKRAAESGTEKIHPTTSAHPSQAPVTIMVTKPQR